MPLLEARDSQIYGGWTIVGPDGRFMFHSGPKKVHWYLRKKLARQVSEHCIQLTFQPNGPGCQDRYRRQRCANQCVVCGGKEELTIHHVVPHRYRQHLCRHFPFVIRDFHDCLATCVKCHQEYESLHVKHMYADIARRFDIPIEGSIGGISLTAIWRKIGKAQQFASVLSRYGDDIPVERRDAMTEFVEGISKQLKVNSVIGLRKEDFGYQTHGYLVMEQVADDNEPDEFVQEWRKHFLKTMEPKFLPRHWDVKRPIFRSKEEFDKCR